MAVALPGVDRRSAALAGIAGFLWAGVRWLGMRLAAPRLYEDDPAALRGALSVGLLGYALAITPELRLVAWLISGAITGILLVRVGRERREVVRAVAIVWGMQAVVVAGGWLARNAFMGVLATRG